MFHILKFQLLKKGVDVDREVFLGSSYETDGIKSNRPQWPTRKARKTYHSGIPLP